MPKIKWKNNVSKIDNKIIKKINKKLESEDLYQ